MLTEKEWENVQIGDEEKTLYVKEALRLDNQLCFPLYACARMVTNLYTPFLKPLGLTYTQYLVFMVLWEQDDVTVGSLCERLFLDSGTITPLLKKMEEKGFVSRYRCPEDERCVKVCLTEAGRDMKEKVLLIPAQVGSCVHLSQKEIIEFKRLLGKVMNTLNVE